MNKMVLILNGNDFNSDFGGQATFIKNLHPYLNKTFTLKYLVMPDIVFKQHIIPWRLVYIFQVLFFLLRRINRFKLIVSHTTEASFVASLFNKPFIHIFHGNNNPLTKSVFWYGKYFKWVFNFFEKRITKKASMLYTVGELRKGAKKIFNPININLSKKEICEKRSDFIFAGRLEEVKNIDDIIEIYNCLPERIKESNYLHIIGTGTQEKKLKKFTAKLKLTDKIIFHGQLTNIQTIKIMSKSLILLMASNYEGFPMAIAESLSVGTPVVSTDVGDIGSIIRNGYNGFLLPLYYNKDDFASKIIEILLNYKSFSSNSLESSSVFNAEQIACTFVSYCKKIMSDITKK